MIKLLVNSDHTFSLSNYLTTISIYLDLDSASLGFGTVLLGVNVVRVVLLSEDLPLLWLVVDEETDNAISSLALAFAAFGTVGLQRIRQHALQLSAVRGAFTGIQQALVVVVEQAVRLQDLFNVDVVEFGGVFVFRAWAGGAEHGGGEEGEQNEVFHLK